jgi:uncharacterized protein YbcI
MIVSMKTSAKVRCGALMRFIAHTSDDALKGTSAGPGGQLTSKPMWASAGEHLPTSAFLCLARQRDRRQSQKDRAAVAQSRANVAQEIARVAKAFEHERTGHLPRSVTVVLGDDTLVITLRGALSEAEKALARSPDGAAEVQAFHRQLFTSAADALRQDIERITGVNVREAAAEIEPSTGMVAKVFTTGTVVQVFLLADSVETQIWSDGNVPGRSLEH